MTARRASLTAGIPRLLASLSLAAALAFPAATGVYGLQVAYRVLMYAILAQAWNLAAGYCGLVSLGSAAFIGIGSYCFLEVTNHTNCPPMLAFVGAGILAAAFSAAISPAVFRLRGLHFTIGTLALAEALRMLAVNLPMFGGATGIFSNLSAPSYKQLYYLALAMACLTALLVSCILRGRLSVALRAVRDDEDVACEMGLNAFRTKLFAFSTSAFLMGLVGALEVLRVGYSEPYGTFGLTSTIDIVTVTIIGGMGTQAGPWVGAVITVILGELLQKCPGVHTGVNGIVLILVIRSAPRGAWGLVGRHGFLGRWFRERGQKPLVREVA